MLLNVLLLFLLDHCQASLFGLADILALLLLIAGQLQDCLYWHVASVTSGSGKVSNHTD